LANHESAFSSLQTIAVMSEETLLEFPCRFPIKAMGKADLELDLLVVEIVRRHAPDINEGAVTTRPSKDGNYIAVTIIVEASSKQQLDAIYQDLTDHPHVLMAL
jgi:putative lipoic acid-binding regulatory protein